MEFKILGFDADDTLWVNEPFYRETEKLFADILSDYLPEESVYKELFEIEIQNLRLYGYGAKGFMLSLIESAIRISNYTIPVQKVEEIIRIGKELLDKPIELLDGVKEVLEILSKKHKLIIATKGDLLDQERKLNKSGLAHFFHHIEVMSDKKEKNYQKLLKNLDIEASDFVMVGNSIKSDILPVVKLGGKAIFVPYHTTWIHEEVDEKETNGLDFITLNSLSELLTILK